MPKPAGKLKTTVPDGFWENLKNQKIMKSLNIEKMEATHGGGFIDGACAVVGFTDAALAVRVLVGASVNPVFGGALIVAGVGCFVYSIW